MNQIYETIEKVESMIIEKYIPKNNVWALMENSNNKRRYFKPIKGA